MKAQQRIAAGVVLQRLLMQNEQLEAQLAATLSRQGLSPSAQALLPELGQALDPARVTQLLQANEPQLPSFGQSYEALCRPSLAQLSASFGAGLIRC